MPVSPEVDSAMRNPSGSQSPTGVQSASTQTATRTGVIAPGRHRVHKSYIVLHAVRLLKEWIFALFAIFLGAIQSLESKVDLPFPLLIAVVAGILVLFLAVIVVFSLISYRRLAWELTETELHLYKGIIARSQTHIPFSKIHALDYNAKVLDRILGIVTLRVDTAGGSLKAEAVIPALKLSEAEALRSEVFARKRRMGTQVSSAGEAEYSARSIASGGVTSSSHAEVPVRSDGAMSYAPSSPDDSVAAARSGEDGLAAEFGRLNESVRGAFAGDYVDEAPIECERRLTTKELFLAGISSNNVFLFLLIGIGGASQVLEFAGINDDEFVTFAEGAANYLFSFGILAAAVVLFFALVIGWIGSVIATAISYGGFTVRRRGGRIEMEKGLLEHKFSGVAIDRVQAVRISQGLIRRIIGYSSVSLETVANLSGTSEGSTGERGLTIHPFIKRSEVDKLLDDLLPEFRDVPKELTPLSSLARRRSINRFTLWTAFLVLLPAILAEILIVPEIEGFPRFVIAGVAFALVVFAAYIGYRSWKGKGYAFNGEMIVASRGAFGLSMVIVPRRRIQFTSVTANPFQRRVSLATLTATTAALGVVASVKDIEADVADGILKWFEPRHESVVPDGDYAGASMALEKDIPAL